jgi:hypothetical protein
VGLHEEQREVGRVRRPRRAGDRRLDPVQRDAGRPAGAVLALQRDHVLVHLPLPSRDLRRAEEARQLQQAVALELPELGRAEAHMAQCGWVAAGKTARASVGHTPAA